MLVPPPRLTAGPDTGTATVQLGEDLDFHMPEGVWSAMHSMQVLAPMPHPSESAPVAVNPLSGEMDHPGMYTSGVRLTPVPVSSSGGVSRSKKPKNSLTRNKSSFLSRTMIYDRFNWLFSEKRLNNASSEASPGATAAFISVGRGMTLLDADFGSPHKADPLARILFTKAWPLCHDINRHTRSPSNLDVIFGMSSGDLVWAELMSGRYNRINKIGNLTHAAITAAAWVPQTESLVAVGHADGTLVVYDVEREDGPTISSTSAPAVASGETFRVFASNRRPHHPQNKAGSNPVAAYKLSNQSVTDIAFNGSTFAVTSRDGYLRLLNTETEQVTDIIPSYFGGLFTVSYSPDKRYVVTCGEDDIISVYRVSDMKLLARLTGHSAWVRKVAWDVYATDLEAGSYRLASVGEDGLLIQWEFNPRSLPRAKLASAPSSSELSVLTQSLSSVLHIGNATVHPVVPRDSVPSVLPTSKVLPSTSNGASLPLSDLFFTSQFIMVAMSDGRLWTWKRPHA